MRNEKGITKLRPLRWRKEFHPWHNAPGIELQKVGRTGAKGVVEGGLPPTSTHAIKAECFKRDVRCLHNGKIVNYNLTFQELKKLING